MLQIIDLTMLNFPSFIPFTYSLVSNKCRLTATRLCFFLKKFPTPLRLNYDARLLIFFFSERRMKNIYAMKSKVAQQERVNSAFKYCQQLQTSKISLLKISLLQNRFFLFLCSCTVNLRLFLDNKPSESK